MTHKNLSLEQLPIYLAIKLKRLGEYDIYKPVLGREDCPKQQGSISRGMKLTRLEKETQRQVHEAERRGAK